MAPTTGGFDVVGYADPLIAQAAEYTKLVSLPDGGWRAFYDDGSQQIALYADSATNALHDIADSLEENGLY